MTVLAAELLLTRPIPATADAVREVMGRIAPQVELVHEPGSQAWILLHHDHLVPFEGGETVPAQTALLVAKESAPIAGYDTARQQCWDFPGVADALRQARHCGLVTDLMCGPLEPAQRLQVIGRTLVAMCEALDVVAIHWQTADRLCDPEVLRKDGLAAATDPTRGALNVRMFRLKDGERDTGEIVMDTLGMQPFGLPDVQCHYRDLEPGRVAGYLFDLAGYLLERGPVVDSGHTVRGLEDDQLWLCQREQAMVGPEREVVDVQPHLPHAGGQRG